jgi:hypothetical protein
MSTPSAMDLRHLRREACTALELAIVELAPSDLIESLATATGMLEALSDLPADSAPSIALVPPTVERARKALERWREWSTSRKKLA